MAVYMIIHTYTHIVIYEPCVQSDLHTYARIHMHVHLLNSIINVTPNQRHIDATCINGTIYICTNVASQT
jgi:hypothetical protein